MSNCRICVYIKNKIYQDRRDFFNIWYLMRFGRKNETSGNGKISFDLVHNKRGTSRVKCTQLKKSNKITKIKRALFISYEWSS